MITDPLVATQEYARALQASIVWRLGTDRPWHVALGLSLSLAGFAAAGVAPPRAPALPGDGNPIDLATARLDLSQINSDATRALNIIVAHQGEDGRLDGEAADNVRELLIAIKERSARDKTPADYRAERAAGPVAWMATSADGKSDSLFFNRVEALAAAGPGGTVRGLR